MLIMMNNIVDAVVAVNRTDSMIRMKMLLLFLFLFQMIGINLIRQKVIGEECSSMDSGIGIIIHRLIDHSYQT